MKCLLTVTILCLVLILVGCGNPTNPGSPQNFAAARSPLDPGIGHQPAPNHGPTTPLAPSPAPASSSLPTYDMLEWMTMGPDLRADHHMAGSANPIYTQIQSDRFFWTKTGQGYPWDIQLYDNNYIYLWVTELNWTNDRTYKVFHSQNPSLGNYNLPLVPRIVTGLPAGASGKLARSR